MGDEKEKNGKHILRLRHTKTDTGDWNPTTRNGKRWPIYEILEVSGEPCVEIMSGRIRMLKAGEMVTGLDLKKGNLKPENVEIIYL